MIGVTVTRALARASKTVCRPSCGLSVVPSGHGCRNERHTRPSRSLDRCFALAFSKNQKLVSQKYLSPLGHDERTRVQPSLKEAVTVGP
jgi:hypothetical protein